MKKKFYSFTISCFILTVISCGKTTEENVNETISKTNESVNNTIHGSSGGYWGDSDFQINPQEVAGLWEFVTT